MATQGTPDSKRVVQTHSTPQQQQQQQLTRNNSTGGIGETKSTLSTSVKTTTVEQIVQRAWYNPVGLVKREYTISKEVPNTTENRTLDNSNTNNTSSSNPEPVSQTGGKQETTETKPPVSQKTEEQTQPEEKPADIEKP